ncbi:MAG: thiamine pyrophosphate-dependent enzyme [Chloroflexota bacterium]|nr:thiamine pyrophosphate-dependent enzyme [Chloroflexota bacterium]
MNQALAEEKVCKKPKLKDPLPYWPLHHCAGCLHGVILRLIIEVLEEEDLEGRAVFIGGGGCSARWASYFDIDSESGIHGPNTAVASAVKRIYPDTLVFVVQGDGEIGAIGLGSFVSAAMRGERITSISLNNACFGTTGGQMAPTTPLGMKTTTSPEGRDSNLTGFPFHGPELVAPLPGVAYAARGSVHNAANFQKSKRMLKNAFRVQLEGLGFGSVEFISTCPSNWRLSPIECLRFVEEQMIPEFPLGEFKNVLQQNEAL